MIETVKQYGFAYSRRGCSCSGSPYIYVLRHYEITLYTKRGLWRLKSHNTSIANGTEAELNQKLQELIKQ